MPDNNLGDVFVSVRADMTDLKGDLNKAGDEISKALKGFFSPGKFAQGVASIAGGFIAAQAPIELVKQALSKWASTAEQAKAEATELANAELRLATAMKMEGNSTGLTAREMANHARALQDSTGVSSSSIMEFQAVLSRFSNVQESVFTRATDLAVDYSVATGRDLRSAAIVLGRALQDPVHGMTLLTRSGIVLTEQQKKLITELGKTGQVAKAQEEILRVLDRQFGRAARNMASPAKLLKSQLSDIHEELGKILKRNEPFKIKLQIAWAEFQKDLTQHFASSGADPKVFGKEASGKNAKSWGKWFADNVWVSVGGGMVDALGMVDFRQKGSFLSTRMDTERTKFKNLQREQDAIDERRLKSQAQANKQAITLAKQQGKTEGVFNPAEFNRIFQESLLQKDDRLLDATKAGNQILEQMLSNMNNNGSAVGAPVAN